MEPVDPKYYISSGSLQIVGHFSGADVAAWYIVARAIETGRLKELGPTIRLGQCGFESAPLLELRTSIIVAAVQNNI